MTIISVIGLGAVGASYAARIADAHPGTELRVVAEGPRAERLRSEGVVVNGERYGVPTPVNAVLLRAFLAKHQLWGVV